MYMTISSILGPKSPERENVRAELQMQSNNIITESQPNTTTKPRSPETEGNYL